MNETKTTPKDFFLYLGMMAALYVSAVALINLWFDYINVLFPSSLDHYYDPSSPSVRFAMAALIIVFPLFVVLTRLVNQSMRREPGKRDIWVRRWLVFLTLFVAGATIVVDLIVLVNTFLGGELSSRFALKVLVVFVVAGAVFWYYLASLRGYWDTHVSGSLWFGGVAALVILGSVVGGFFIIGSPATQRDLRMDQTRVNDLQNIQWQIVDYWRSKEALPETLEALEDPIRGFIVPRDPYTDAPYEYAVHTLQSFELCATFALESVDTPKGVPRGRVVTPYPEPAAVEPLMYPGDVAEGTWDHDAGRTCFERTIDPELYPPYTKSVTR